MIAPAHAFIQRSASSSCNLIINIRQQYLTANNSIQKDYDGQVAELEKMAALHPGARLLLRLRADDPGARCQLGNKYGAAPAAARGLLQVRMSQNNFIHSLKWLR